MKDVHIGNNRHLPIIFETGDNTVLQINGFIFRKWLLTQEEIKFGKTTFRSAKFFSPKLL